MSSKKHRLAIFASGNGTNAEQIMKYFQRHPSVEVAMLLSNNPMAFALLRARPFKVKTFVFNRAQFRESDEVLNQLKQMSVSHLVLAGFLWLVPSNLIKAYPHGIINIHPALLPRHGGKGMYGKHVHEAVKAAQETETGITIHEVNERYDEGKILFQARCPLSPSDSVEKIAQKVHELEYEHYPKAIERWVLG